MDRPTTHFRNAFTSLATGLLALCIGCETSAQRATREAWARVEAEKAAEVSSTNDLLTQNLSKFEQAKSAVSVREEEIRRRYDTRAHVPDLLAKYPDATRTQRAFLEDAWVCPGMPKHMVLDTLLGARIESESTTSARHVEHWKWRAWRLMFVNDSLAEIRRSY